MKRLNIHTRLNRQGQEAHLGPSHINTLPQGVLLMSQHVANRFDNTIMSGKQILGYNFEADPEEFINHVLKYAGDKPVTACGGVELFECIAPYVNGEVTLVYVDQKSEGKQFPFEKYGISMFPAKVETDLLKDGYFHITYTSSADLLSCLNKGCVEYDADSMAELMTSIVEVRELS